MAIHIYQAYFQIAFTSLMRVENRLCQAARLKEREAQEDGIAHASPNRAGYVARYGDCLYQHRVNADAYHNEKRLKTKSQQGF